MRAKAVLAGGLAAALLAAGADAAPARHLVNGVNVLEPLTIGGAEPFWGATVKGSRVIWSDPEHERLIGKVGRPRLTPDSATWRGTVSRLGAFTLTLTPAEECSDGMSDYTFPLEATVAFREYTYRGCAGTQEAFARARKRSEGMVR